MDENSTNWAICFTVQKNPALSTYLRCSNLSSSYPAEPYGFIVSAGTCAYSLNLHGQEIKAMLGSFRP